MDLLTPLQQYGILGIILSIVLVAIYFMFMYIKRIEARSNNQHVKRETKLMEQADKQRLEFEAFITAREDKLIKVITDSNQTHIRNTETMNEMIKDMAEMFADINAKNNKQHLDLTNTMRSLVIENMNKNQELFIQIVNKNTEALTSFKDQMK